MKKNAAVNYLRHETGTSDPDDLRLEDKTGDIITRVINDADGMVSISDEWDELVSDSCGTIFQTFDWQYQWWRHFASEDRCRPSVVVMKQKDRLIGLAPFFIQTYRTMGIVAFRHLKLIGSGLRSERTKVLSLEREGPGDYLDVIARRGYEEIVAGSVAHLIKMNSGQWDEIELQNLPEDGIIMRHMLPILKDPTLRVAVEASDVCPKIALPATLDDYLSTVDQRTRRSLRRSQRTYLESTEFSIEDQNCGGGISALMRELIMLHQRHWNSTGYPGLFADKRFESMQMDLAEVLEKKNRLWLSILRHEGKPIAARLCFTFNGCVSDYLSGVEHTERGSGTAGYSGAGIALMMAAISRAIKCSCKTLDLLRGDEHYKMGLASSTPRNYFVAISPAGKRKKLRYTGYRFKSAGFSLSSRIACESEIFRIISKDVGHLRALPRYAGHLKKRIRRPGRTSFDAADKQSSRDGSDVRTHVTASKTADVRESTASPGNEKEKV